MSQSCSGKCQTFISRRPKMGSNFVHYFIIIIKYYLEWNLFPANLLCVCLSRQRTMRKYPNTPFLLSPVSSRQAFINYKQTPEKL